MTDHVMFGCIYVITGNDKVQEKMLFKDKENPDTAKIDYVRITSIPLSRMEAVRLRNSSHEALLQSRPGSLHCRRQSGGNGSRM